MKILVADDEQSIRRLISAFLKKEQYSVIEAADGQEALEQFYQNPDIGLCVLDVMMPSVNGYDVCRTIRAESNVPILLLTAKSEDEDQITGFQTGADDYMTKPFSLPVLIMHIKSLLKRSNVSETQKTEELSLKGVRINTESHKVYVDDEKVELTPKEYELLLYLFQNQKIVISRAQIMQHVWGYDYYGDERTVDAHIKNLRLKLKDNGSLIQTVRGYGYTIDPDEN